MSARRSVVLLSALTLALTGIPVTAPTSIGPSSPLAVAEAGPDAAVFVNEIHYANTGVDTGEFVELAGPSGTDLTGFEVVLYDGETGQAYASRPLTETIDVSGVTVVDYPVEGIQDGPDAVALVEAGGVSQFLSWGGDVTATDGPAGGLTSTDIGVAETDTTTVDSSLQVTGTGDTSGDFRWTGPIAGSPGAPNDGQSLTSNTAGEAVLPTQVADVVEPGEIVEATVPASDPAIERLIEGESLAESATGTAVTVQESTGALIWSGNAQLRVDAIQAGDAATVTFQVPVAGRYRFAADMTSGPNFGRATLAIDGVKVGEEFNGAIGTQNALQRRIRFGDIDLAVGDHTLTLTAVAPNTNGQIRIGLDLMRLRLLPAEGRLTLTPGHHDAVRGKVPVYGWSTDPADTLALKVDHDDVVDWDALGDPAMLIYDGRFIDAGPAGADFQDGISVRGQKTIIDYDVGADNTFDVDTIDISGELLRPGENEITFFTGPDPGDPEGNKDDFDVRNLRLVLADGTVLRDPTKPITTIYRIDDATPQRVWTFTIPPVNPPAPVYTPARGYVLDTKFLADGDHLVTLVAGGPAGPETLNHRVTVDNGAPIVTDLSPADGSTVKGSFILDATVTDAGDQRPHVAATLDSAPVELGTTMNSDDLTEGEHTFTVTVTDAAGNTASETATFTSVAQTPDAPQLVSPEDGATGVPTDATLRVRASDPDDDPLQVTFLQATPVVGPPLLAAGGSTTGDAPPLSATGSSLDPQAAAESDDVYADAPPTTDFPYQRYDIPVSRVRGAKQVDVSWEGRIASDREVVLSVYDITAQRWTEIAVSRGNEGADTTVVGTARLGRTNDEGRVHVLVQARDPFPEIPSEADEAFAEPETYDFSVAWMTDTQYLSEGAVLPPPENDFELTYEAINDWIVDNREQRKIVYAAHTGDIINNWQPNDDSEAIARAEFQFASDTMKVLEDAGIPNGVIPGNHDNRGGMSNILYNEYFPPSRYDAAEETAPTGEDGEGYYGGSWRPDDNQNHYDLIEVAGQRLIFLYLGFIVGPDEIAWANQVLADHRDRKAVVLTHTYLLPSMASDGRGGELNDVDGIDLFNQVVLPNENVFLTLSGHVHGVALNIKRDLGVKGRAVVEMMSNYQFFEVEEQRRTGHIRLLQFTTEGSNLSVNTYSPFLDDHNAEEFDTMPGRDYAANADEFIVPVDLASRTTGFRTDSVGLALRTDTVIGTVSVPSGEVAEVTWKGLTAGTRYGWYARATDPDGVFAESTAFTFTTTAPLPAAALSPAAARAL